jgi:hypothetical protein
MPMTSTPGGGLPQAASTQDTSNVPGSPLPYNNGYPSSARPRRVVVH